MFCESCGNKLAPTAKFCMECGAKIEADRSVLSNESSKYSTQAQEEIAEETRQEQEREHDTSEYEETRQEKAGRKKPSLSNVVTDIAQQIDAVSLDTAPQSAYAKERIKAHRNRRILLYVGIVYVIGGFCGYFAAYEHLYRYLTVVLVAIGLFLIYSYITENINMERTYRLINFAKLNRDGLTAHEISKVVHVSMPTAQKLHNWAVDNGFGKTVSIVNRKGKRSAALSFYS